jgi:CYTH domain-containing protein
MIEKERKFLLKQLPSDLYYMERIEQGYVMIDGKTHLRVRIIDSSKGYLTLKSDITESSKLEYEYEIPLSDAIGIFELSKYWLKKIRYKTTYKGNSVDIDVYKNGLSIVEIEYENELVDIPDYCGEEVTGKKEYSNIQLAMNNEHIS